MKFALHNDEKKEAETNLKGAVCQVCKSEVIAKCGNIKIHHWAHKSRKKCDHWWENETQWHRAWKNHFPIDWQEVVHISKTGEKHIADVKLPKGLVVEFQHSPIKPEEILARNNFYENIIWVVDGKRRKSDEKKFEETIKFSKELRGKRMYLNESTLLKNWSNIHKTVFFDFGKTSLWGISDGWIIEFEKDDFIEGVKMGGKTLTYLLKEKVKNLHLKERQKEEEEKKKRRLWVPNGEKRAWLGINNPVTRHRRRGRGRRFPH